MFYYHSVSNTRREEIFSDISARLLKSLHLLQQIVIGMETWVFYYHQKIRSHIFHWNISESEKPEQSATKIKDQLYSDLIFTYQNNGPL
jgi:hypothetical protein